MRPARTWFENRKNNERRPKSIETVKNHNSITMVRFSSKLVLLVSQTIQKKNFCRCSEIIVCLSETRR